MTRRFETATIALTVAIAGLLALGCGERADNEGDLDGGPPADLALTQTKVSITNGGVESLYVSGDKMPFRVKDGNGKVWDTAIPPCGLACDTCGSFCSNPYFCDSQPCYLEIPPGDTLTLTWSGLIYDGSQACSCSSNTSCYAAKALGSGTATFLVPYSRTLDTKGRNSAFTRQQCSQLPVSAWGGVASWSKSELGTSLGLSEVHSVSVDVTSLDHIVLNL